MGLLQNSRPPIIRIIKMFDSITLPTEISRFLFTAAVIDVVNSCKLVPIAITVIDTILSLIPITFEMLTAPSTNKFDPITRQ